MRRWVIGFLSRAHLAAYRLSRGRAFGSEPRLTVDHLIDDATDGGYDDGTRLHIAAATVSPQPAVRLFCTTTAACL